MRVAFALSHGDDVEVPPPAPKNYKKAPARQAVNPSMCPESHKVVVLLADGETTVGEPFEGGEDQLFDPRGGGAREPEIGEVAKRFPMVQVERSCEILRSC